MIQRPVADELSKSKWIKSASKLPMIILRELIYRYRSWIQTGGQRASLAGMDSLVREDTFDVEEDLWDFDANTVRITLARPGGGKLIGVSFRTRTSPWSLSATSPRGRWMRKPPSARSDLRNRPVRVLYTLRDSSLSTGLFSRDPQFAEPPPSSTVRRRVEPVREHDPADLHQHAERNVFDGDAPADDFDPVVRGDG